MNALKQFDAGLKQFAVLLKLSLFRLALGLLLLLGAVVIIFSQILSVVNAPPIIIEDTVDDATIYFYVDRSVVAFPGNCVTVCWVVEGIKEVYLNVYSLVGEGERQWCETTDRNVKPTLRVLLRDETWRTYPAKVKTLWIELNTPLLAIWAVGLFVAGAYALKTPWLTPFIDQLCVNERFQELSLALWMFGVILVYWLFDGYGINTLMDLLQRMKQFLNAFFFAPYQG